MLPTHLTRRQLFWLVNCNKANFSMICNGKLIPEVVTNPMTKRNETTILNNKQQFRSFWHSRPIQNSSDNSSANKLAENDHPIAAEQQKKEEKIARAKHITLASKNFHYEQPTKWVSLKYVSGKTGSRYLQIFTGGDQTKVHTKVRKFPNVNVPEDLFAFVRAMDEVLNAVEMNREKIEAQPKTDNPDQQEDYILLHTAMAKGIYYDFQLDLCLGPSLTVQMRKVPREQNPEFKPKHIAVPIGIFHGLRLAIGEVVVVNGEEKEVQQQLGEAPSLPDWLDKEDFTAFPTILGKHLLRKI